MSLLIIDDSIILYALKNAYSSRDADKVNWICQRVGESVQYMQLGTLTMLNDDITHRKTSGDYVLDKPFDRLAELITNKLAEYSI